MTAKSLKKFIKLLNKSDGISLTPIIVIMVLMSIMGGVFTSIMGGWKVSAPLTVNSNRAFYQAEVAAMFALQEAKNNFYRGSFNFGTRTTPYVVSTSTTEVADYWIERPAVDDPTLYTNDDATTAPDDDTVDDDNDDISNPTRYTITATGKVKEAGGTTLAKRQIKILADITPLPLNDLRPGVHTEGAIQGNGASGYNMWLDGLDVSIDPPTVSFISGIFPNSTSPPTSGSRANIVYQPPADTVPSLNEDFFLDMAKDQVHYYVGNLDPGNNFPNGSFYDSGSIPNVTYVGGDLTENDDNIIYGVYYVKGNVTLGGNCQVQGIVICESDFTVDGGGNKSPNIDGGVVQNGSNTLIGNVNPVEIQINDTYFSDLRAVMPSITVVSWQEGLANN